MNTLFRPKNENEVLESLREIELPSYRLSSFLKLIRSYKNSHTSFTTYDDYFKRAEELENWCRKAFHTDPKDMDVTHINSDIIKRILNKSFPFDIHTNSFASNTNYKIMFYREYIIYPKGKLGQIISDIYSKNYLKR